MPEAKCRKVFVSQINIDDLNQTRYEYITDIYEGRDFVEFNENHYNVIHAESITSQGRADELVRDFVREMYHKFEKVYEFLSSKA